MAGSTKSCETWRQTAYDEDLRWRMVWQREALEYSYSVIASHLNVDKATVCPTIHLFHNTGKVSKKSYPTDVNTVLSSTAQLFILNLVVSNPGIYLREIQAELSEMLMMNISLSSICKLLHKSGFTHQKLHCVALQQDIPLREQFTIDVSHYSPDMFVFIDETGADRRNTLRKYGYSLRGKPATKKALLVRGERVSAIACMTINGILDVKTHKETSNGDNFLWLHSHPSYSTSMPFFDGHSSRSVVVLDNCSIHHCAEVVASLRDIGVMVHFLPPYSPDSNPIEEAFSKVKTELRSIEAQFMDIETTLLASFTTLREQDCRGWIAHSGVHNL